MRRVIARSLAYPVTDFGYRTGATGLAKPNHLDERVLAGEDRGDRVVGEDIPDRVRKDPADGQDFDVVRLREGIDCAGVGHDEPVDLAVPDPLESRAVEQPVCR